MDKYLLILALNPVPLRQKLYQYPPPQTGKRLLGLVPPNSKRTT